MNFVLVFLGMVAMCFSTHALAGSYGKHQGDAEGFMISCISKHSSEFCQCAMDFGFEKAQKSLYEHEELKVQNRKSQVVKAKENSMRLDSTITVEHLDTLCDVSDAFYAAKEEYLLNAVGDKNPPSYDGKHNKPIYEIQKKYDKQTINLHDQFGSNDTTRSHYSAFGGGYCTQRRGLVKDEQAFQEYVKKDQAGDVQVIYRSVIGPAVRHATSPCKDMIKK